MLELAPEVEDTVREYASREGVSVSDLIARAFPPLRETQEERIARAKALVRRWQEEDGTLARHASVPVQSLDEMFREWEEEDSRMSDEEREAAEQAWEDFKRGINEERAAAGARLIF